MDYLSKLSDIELDSIGLERENNEVNIKIPDEANIYKMTLGRYLNSEDINKKAIIYERDNGEIETFSFGEIEKLATGLAIKLTHLGYGFGDNIAVHTGQHPDTAIAHMAICKIGGIAVTLSQL